MRSGFVAVVGRPNTGKSTLVNALVGAKVAITSARPQTTRNTIRGIMHRPGLQAVFVDTPGLHKPRRALGARLNRLVHGTLAEADAVLLVVDARAGVGSGDRTVAGRVGAAAAPAIGVVNKTDVASPAQVAAALAAAGEWDLAAYVPVSARRAEGFEPLVAELEGMLPEGPPYYPEGMATDQPEELLVAETIREKFLSRLRQELPHSLVVSLSDMEWRDNGALYVAGALLVERESQKGIVVGKGGAVLRAAGAEARRELEARFAAPVYLDLRVKVEKDWQDRAAALDRLGWR